MLDIITASATAYGTTARTWVGVISRRLGRTHRNITPAAITPRTQTAPSGPAATKAVVAIAVPNWTLVVDARTSAMGRQIPIGQAFGRALFAAGVNSPLLPLRSTHSAASRPADVGRAGSRFSSKPPRRPAARGGWGSRRARAGGGRSGSPTATNAGRRH